MLNNKPNTKISTQRKALMQRIITINQTQKCQPNAKSQAQHNIINITQNNNPDTKHQPNAKSQTQRKLSNQTQKHRRNTK